MGDEGLRRALGEITNEYLLKKYEVLLENCFEFAPKKEWLPAIADLLGYLEWARTRPYQPLRDLRVAQVKSKWGQLRVYVDGGDDRVEGAIGLTEVRCMQ